MKLIDLADVIRYNDKINLSDDDEHIVVELSATKGKVEILKNGKIYSRHAVLILKDKRMKYLMYMYLSFSMPKIRASYLENMNFKLNDIKNIEVHKYFNKFKL